MRAGEQECNPTSRQPGRSQRGKQRIFFYHTEKYKGKKQAVIQRDKLRRERQTGRKTERQAETNTVDSARP